MVFFIFSDMLSDRYNIIFGMVFGIAFFWLLFIKKHKHLTLLEFYDKEHMDDRDWDKTFGLKYGISSSEIKEYRELEYSLKQELRWLEVPINALYERYRHLRIEKEREVSLMTLRFLELDAKLNL